MCKKEAKQGEAKDFPNPGGWTTGWEQLQIWRTYRWFWCVGTHRGSVCCVCGCRTVLMLTRAYRWWHQQNRTSVCCHFFDTSLFAGWGATVDGGVMFRTMFCWESSGPAIHASLTLKPRWHFKGNIIPWRPWPLSAGPQIPPKNQTRSSHAPGWFKDQENEQKLSKVNCLRV